MEPAEHDVRPRSLNRWTLESLTYMLPALIVLLTSVIWIAAAEVQRLLESGPWIAAVAFVLLIFAIVLARLRRNRQ